MPRDPNAPPPRPAYLPPDQLRQAYQEQAKVTGSHSLAFRHRALAADQATEGEPYSPSRAPSAESRGTPDSVDSAWTNSAATRRPK